MVTRIEISRTVLDAIQAHAAADAPREACGLLFGNDSRIDASVPAANVADDPQRHFEVDPAILLQASRAARAGGPTIAGYYHSHPSGCAEPSETDQRMAAPDGRLWLIVAGDTVTAWRNGKNGFEAVTLAIV
ncbi:M67 family metallopeptidase [Sphingomonas tabacisoli]|uniref:M67 family metallopeptidase n=1 Tax=Sphingomonas tabacisoli TaxID=2249466 RepID=A0ABW4I276_9SPHN